MSVDNKGNDALPPLPNQKLEEMAAREESRFNSLLLKDKSLLSDSIAKGITFRFFQDKMQSQLFAIIARHYDNYDALLTRQTFESVVASHPNIKDEDGARLRSAFDATFAEEATKDDYEALRDGINGRYVQRQAYAALQKHFDPILRATSGQIKLVESMIADMSNIKGLEASTFNKAVSLSDVLRDHVLPEIAERREHPEKFWGLMSGFDCLDRVYHGFVKGRYMVILAMENGGKTTFMFNMARNMVMQENNIVYVTIEAPATETSMRFLTIHAAVNYNRIMAGGKDNETGLPDFIYEELKKSGEDLITGAGTKFHWIQVLQNTPAKQILGMIERKMSFTDIDAVFLDYLDVVGKDVRYPNRPDLDLAAVSEAFQSWGREHNILIVTAQQLKTEKGKQLYDKKEDASEMRVGVSDTSGSKKIAGAADYMLSLLIDLEAKNRLYVWATKARQGKSAMRWVLSLDMDSGRLEDIPGESGYEALAERVKKRHKHRKKNGDPIAMSLPVGTSAEDPSKPVIRDEIAPPSADKPLDDDGFAGPGGTSGVF